MIYKSEWCWDTAEEGQSLRGEAWSGRVCALKKRTLYYVYKYTNSLTQSSKDKKGTGCIFITFN